jgi:hypothetical protein
LCGCDQRNPDPQAIFSRRRYGYVSLNTLCFAVAACGGDLFFMEYPPFHRWMAVCRAPFFLYSIAGVVIFSAAMLLAFPIIQIQDMILAALAAGINTGIGSGIILKTLGSAGGLDILSVILFKKYSLRPGTFTLAFNAVLIGFAAFRIPLEMILYTLIYIYVTSYFFNLVVVGLSQRKSQIFKTNWRTLKRTLLDRVNKIRQETTNVMDKLGIEIKRHEKKQDSPENQ